MLNALTIDVEDYFQVANFEKVVGFYNWDRYESRVADNTIKILDIFSEKNVKATFFVLGWIAQRFPGLVKKIHSQGHEIASHGYSHQLIYQQSPLEFKQDIRNTNILLEQITGKPVLGYRAPTYSITKDSLWALDVLNEEGFKYDSSIFPAYHDKGGISGANPYLHRIENSNGGILEFPISTIQILGQNIPFAGGGYFRLFPYWFVKLSMKKINNKGYPAIVHLHPWEIDPRQPRIKTDSLGRFRHYLNLDKTESKLKRLLNDFKFAPVKEVLGLK